MQSPFPPTPPRQIDELQAFDAMRHFVEAYYERGGRSSEEIVMLLSMMERDMWANGMPNDPAFWQDWTEAVNKVLKD